MYIFELEFAKLASKATNKQSPFTNICKVCLMYLSNLKKNIFIRTLNFLVFCKNTLRVSFNWPIEIKPESWRLNSKHTFKMFSKGIKNLNFEFLVVDYFCPAFTFATLSDSEFVRGKCFMGACECSISMFCHKKKWI